MQVHRPITVRLVRVRASSTLGMVGLAQALVTLAIHATFC